MDERLVGAVVVIAHPTQPSEPVASDADDGVDDEVDAEAVSAQLHAHRVDQERHVLGHRLHDRVCGLPPV